MQHIRPHIDRWFTGFIGIFILVQVCLGLKDTDISRIQPIETKGISSLINPKGYFVSKIAPLFADWDINKGISTEKKINELFRELDVEVKIIENTIRSYNGSFEFLVHIPKYKKEFLFRYTPLAGDLAKLVQTEEFRLEIKLFSSWMSVNLNRLFS